jgi:prefoldin alpha subunit
MIQVSINDCKMAINTLGDLTGEPELEALVPIGSGSFIHGHLLNNDKVIVDIGAGFRIEKSVEGAKEILDRRCQNLQNIMENMNQTISRIAERMQAIETTVAQQQGMQPRQ